MIGNAWFFIQLRYMKPFLSFVPNHWVERSLGFVADIVSPVVTGYRRSLAEF